MAEKINLHSLAQQLDFDPDDIRRMAAMFFKSTEKTLGILDDAVRSNDMEAIYKAAHSIKGSAGALQLNELHSYALEIEMAGRHNVRIDYAAAAKKLADMVRSIEIE